MDNNILKVLKSLQNGTVNIETALTEITSTFADKNKEVRLDSNRKERCGFHEYIYGANKTALQLVEIINTLYKEDKVVLVTRIGEDVYTQIKKDIPIKISYDRIARVIYYFPYKEKNDLRLKAMVVTAGTSDVPIALESKYTIEASGFDCELVFDVGVAGIHRLFGKMEDIKSADVLIVVAGMEGALPSVIGGLVSIPVIAVPTSVGYGTSFNGVTALLGMLNSCASGISVMNIDNGFGAGCAAVRILNAMKRKSTRKTATDPSK